VGEGIVVYRVVGGRPEDNRPQGRPRHILEHNINLDLTEIGIDEANWIQLAQDSVQWRGCVITVMNLGIP
jgi:hypothetical protein